MRTLKTYEIYCLFAGGLYLLGLGLYSNALSGPFILDDYAHIRDNPSIRLTEFDVDSLYRAGFESPARHRPLAYISFALNYYFGDYNVLGYHLVNVLIHIANGVLVFFLISLTARIEDANRQRWVGFVAGVIFLVHPIQIQAVTYLVERMTSLATFFYLLSLLSYGLGRHTTALAKRVALWCLCAVAGVCAIATKEIAITLPLALLLWEWYASKENVSAVLKRCWPVLLLATGMAAGGLFLFPGSTSWESVSTFDGGHGLSVGQRALSQTRVMVVYLGLLIWPTPERLNLLHEMSPSYAWLAPPSTLFCALVLAVSGGLSLWLKRFIPMVSFGLVWLFGHLVFGSSLDGTALLGEHRVYLPMVGGATVVACGLVGLLVRYRVSGMALAIGMVVLLGSVTYLRKRDLARQFDLVGGCSHQKPPRPACTQLPRPGTGRKRST